MWHGLIKRYCAKSMCWFDSVTVRIGMVRLIGVVMLCIVVTMLLLWIKSQLFFQSSVHRHSTSGLMIHTQRIGKTVNDVLTGRQAAFDELMASRRAFEHDVQLLSPGKWGQESMTEDAIARRNVLSHISLHWQQADQGIVEIAQARQALVDRAKILRRLTMLLPELNATANQFDGRNQGASQVVMQHVGPMMLSVLSLVQATHIAQITEAKQTIQEKHATQSSIVEDGVFQADALLHGDVLAHPRADTLKVAAQLRTQVATYRDLMAVLLVNAAVVDKARYAAQRVMDEHVVLADDLSLLAKVDQGRRQFYRWIFWLMQCVIGLSLLCVTAIVRLRWQQDANSAEEAAKRLVDAENERCYAQQQEEKAIRANEDNEQAILLLTTALQQVAAGDLTVRIPVSDNVVSKIADAINGTIHALRVLVGRTIQMTQDVTQVTAAFGQDFNRLMAVSRHQSAEINHAEQSIQTMTRQMSQVLHAAKASADVARQSVVFAEHGGHAVDNIVQGMNETREHIQETSKRIKRLGDSSLEIGDIIELVSGITEQMNVLALNVAIQAASAGDAGRGLTVVAEEVQRLAERSATATRQIARLVKTIQVDTHDAVSAMEKSTAGVVDAARLSDAAGVALSDIRRVSNALAELVGGIVGDTKEQTEFAEQLATTMQSMLTENMTISAGRDQFKALYEELDNVAGELKQSVSRFRIATV